MCTVQTGGTDGKEYVRGGKQTGGDMSGWKND